MLSLHLILYEKTSIFFHVIIKKIILNLYDVVQSYFISYLSLSFPLSPSSSLTPASPSDSTRARMLINQKNWNVEGRKKMINFYSCSKNWFFSLFYVIKELKKLFFFIIKFLLLYFLLFIHFLFFMVHIFYTTLSFKKSWKSLIAAHDAPEYFVSVKLMKFSNILSRVLEVRAHLTKSHFFPTIFS